MSEIPYNYWKCVCGAYNPPRHLICTTCCHSKPVLVAFEACDQEGDLHDEIETELRARGWYYVHSRMDKPTTNQVGCPDFIIAAPDGRTIWVEVKSKTGKLTTEQNALRAMLQKQGHEWHCVRSIDEFKSVL